MISASQILLREIGVPKLRVVLGDKISAVQVDYIHDHVFVSGLCLIDCRLRNGLKHLIRCVSWRNGMTQRKALHLVVGGLRRASGNTLILTRHGGLRLLLHCDWRRVAHYMLIWYAVKI